MLFLVCVLWVLVLFFDFYTTFRGFRVFRFECFIRRECNLLFRWLLGKFRFSPAALLYGFAELSLILFFSLLAGWLLGNVEVSFVGFFGAFTGLHLFAALNNLAVLNTHMRVRSRQPAKG